MPETDQITKMLLLCAAISELPSKSKNHDSGVKPSTVFSVTKDPGKKFVKIFARKIYLCIKVNKYRVLKHQHTKLL